jgi:diguanylate cyclase (GGDEF)-like protein/PAS domain S-box-containing protein
VTSWNRRLNAASSRPTGAEPRTSRIEVLAEAMAAGVVEEDQHALMAMANIARDRPGFHKTLDVRAMIDNELLELEFEILYDPDGPLVRLSDNIGTAPAPATLIPEDAPSSGDDDSGTDVINILTDTLVETPDLVAIFASVGHEALWANDAFVTVVPIRESDKIWFVELLDEWSKGHYEVKVLPALVKYGRWRGRLTLITGVDSSMAVSAVIVAHRDKRGEIEAVSLVARDMSEIRGAEGGELVTDSRFAALVENAADIIAVLNEEGIVQYASPAAIRILGSEEGALEGTNLLDLVHPDDRPGELLSLARPDDQGIGAPVELRLKAADGSWRHLEVVVTDLTENSSIGGVVLNARDVTERVAAVSALASKAFTDVLTDLPGRVRLLDRLATLMQDGVWQALTVLLVDIDRVRNVNEHLGRDAGDELLRQAAKRLTALTPANGFLARLGGDEFVIVLSNPSATDGIKLGNDAREAIGQPMELAGGPFDVTVSVGIASVKAGEVMEPEALLRNAERAVAQAKASGRDRVEVYTDEMAMLASRRRTVEQTLRHALDNDGVRVHYQPIVDIATEAFVGAEALLRVHDEEGGLLSPAEFIEAAESSGLISRLGSQVLHTTCAQLAAWGSSAGGTLPVEISVNMSPRQLADPALPTHVVDALNAAGVMPEKLWLEITESILIGAQSTIDASIAYLRSLGVRIGLDDFGAGQSSLGYLKRFPLDFVKIDRTLIAGLGVNEHDTAIVRATIELAHNLGLIVVAVGVENDEQLEYLQLLGCDRAQGYYFAPPVPAEEFANVVSKGK